MKSFRQLLMEGLDTSRVYTGTQGFYSYVCPTPDSIAKIKQLCSAVGVTEPDNELHVTVMFSRKHPISFDSINKHSKKYFVGAPTHATYFEGHDKSGYFVLELDSLSLRKQHSVWKTLGAQHSFDDYKPHVTIAAHVGPLNDELKNKQRLCNLNISRNITTLEFGQEQFQDIQDKYK